MALITDQDVTPILFELGLGGCALPFGAVRSASISAVASRMDSVKRGVDLSKIRI